MHNQPTKGRFVVLKECNKKNHFSKLCVGWSCVDCVSSALIIPQILFFVFSELAKLVYPRNKQECQKPKR